MTPMPLQTDDEELLRLFIQPAAKEKAFAAIIDKYSEKLYWHIRRLVIHHEDANDVLQNTWLKSWNGLAHFRKDAKLYTWLYRIATNESLSLLEQQKKSTTIPLDDVSDWLSDKLSSETGFDANKLEWKIQAAIQKLPEKQKIVFTLRYYDEMPYQDISNILGTSIGALKANYHHAVRKIEDFILNH
jgi:RNA polymerase sigma factor (sigma-70 family)